MNFNEVWKSGEHISQTVFKEEGEVLYKAVMELPENSIIVEIGCYVGRSTHVLAQTAKLRNSRVITIDPFLTKFDGWDGNNAKKYFVRDVLSVFDNVQLIEEYSQNVVDRVPEMDFLFIDGDHSYEGVKRDCENYLPKLKSGRNVSFHDYNGSSFAELRKAVDECCGSWEIVNNAWSVTTRRKP